MMFATARTGRVTEDVYAVRTMMVNLYIIRNGDRLVCIDAGLGEKGVEKGFQKLGFNPLSVTHLFLTHSDSDHTGGMGAFRYAEVYLSVAEEQMVNGKTARTSGKKFNKPLGRAYRTIGDGQIIRAGQIEIRAISVPGHTPGSTAYLADGRYLFTGDALSLVRNRVHTSPSFFNMDTETQKRSICRLAGLENVQWLFTAHSGYTKDFAGAMKAWREC